MANADFDGTESPVAMIGPIACSGSGTADSILLPTWARTVTIHPVGGTVRIGLAESGGALVAGESFPLLADLPFAFPVVRGREQGPRFRRIYIESDASGGATAFNVLATAASV